MAPENAGPNYVQRFCCPLQQHDPDGNPAMSCQGQGFKSISQLGDHLKRVHTNQSEMRGTQLSQTQSVKIRKAIEDYHPNEPNENKWRAIYGAIFPGEGNTARPFRVSCKQLLAEVESPSENIWEEVEVEMVRDNRLLSHNSQAFRRGLQYFIPRLINRLEGARSGGLHHEPTSDSVPPSAFEVAQPSDFAPPNSFMSGCDAAGFDQSGSNGSEESFFDMVWFDSE